MAAASSNPNNRTELERLKDLGVSALREMRDLRKGNSPTVIILATKKDALEATVQDCDDDEEEGEEDEELKGEGIPIEFSRKDPLLAALIAAYNSNDDLYVDPTKVRVRAEKVMADLTGYSDKWIRAAIFITHLWRGTFVGMHSYTFRRDVVVNNKVDLNRLYEKDYVWPEVHNNDLLDELSKAAYDKVDKSEIIRIRSMLERGEELPSAETMVCYTNNGACDGIKRCAITVKREIIVPGMKDSKPVGYCFRREVLFDVLLTESPPANPETGEAFPPVLVKNMYEKYKGELLMRAYYLETTANEGVVE